MSAPTIRIKITRPSGGAPRVEYEVNGTQGPVCGQIVKLIDVSAVITPKPEFVQQEVQVDADAEQQRSIDVTLA